MSQPMHGPRPDPPAGTPVWTGDPARCGVCRGYGRPVHTHDGWRVPVHAWGKGGKVACPGSLAAVPVTGVPAP